MFQPKGTIPAMSNAERQRQFRERNPGYYGRLHRQRRARVKACAAQLAIAESLAKAAQQERVLSLVAKPMLCLPAPAVVFPVLPTREEIAARAEQRELQALAANR
jgi:hypothetical protein